ncbi:hypothetical protein T05_12870 [Trichinella murrelli]|uniref:Uncharacterized protein n=1 Tax=Trichinella murrelli TaxID=144512 RepID=A0A0V0UF02_9BILA|nr:hypothetical protein T05_12870 [Trichinella murrelli]
MLEAMLGNTKYAVDEMRRISNCLFSFIRSLMKVSQNAGFTNINIIFWSVFFPEKKSPQEQMTSWDRWKYCSPLLKGVSQSLGQSASSQSISQSVGHLIDDQRTTTPTSFCDTRSAVRIVD